jgi:hypothetical protein
VFDDALVREEPNLVEFRNQTKQAIPACPCDVRNTAAKISLTDNTPVNYLLAFACLMTPQCFLWAAPIWQLSTRSRA